MTSSQIKVEANNDKTYARILRLDLPSKRARTPQRALNAKIGPFSELEISSEEINICEIYKNVSVKKLDDIDNDKDRQDIFVRDYLRPIKIRHANTIVVGIFEIDTSDGYPEERHIDYISDLIAAPQVDIVATPLFSPKGKFETWLNFTKRFIKNVSDKPIIASIPSIPHKLLDGIVDELFKLEVRMFALDFNATNPASDSKYPHVRTIKKKIKSLEGDSDAIMFYGLNVKYGKIVNPKTFIPAKDMLSPVFGVDIFGINHKRTFPKVPFRKPMIRVFESSCYYYLDLNDPAQSSLVQDLPLCKYSLESIRSIKSSDINEYLKCINAERQTKEIITLRKTIEKNTTHEYLTLKSGIKNEKNLQKLLHDRSA
jgi:hypothetical protein